MRREDFDDRAPGEVVEIETDVGTAHAFDPEPLPPADLSGERHATALGEAAHAVGRLDGFQQGTQAVAELLRPFQMKEALASLRIESVHTSFSEVYAVKMGRDELVEDPRPARLALNYYDALRTGVNTSMGGLHSPHNIRSAHGSLFEGDGLPDPDAGSFRDIQNYIGSPRGGIQRATYVPPEPERVEAHMRALHSFADGNSRFHPLTVTALVHYQFETIHPFVDGNGRAGRLFAALHPAAEGILSEPCLPISTSLQSRRRDYFDLLTRVSKEGVWDEWLEFFHSCLAETARETFDRTSQLTDLRETYRDRYGSGRTDNHRVLADWLFSHPFVDVATAAEVLDVHYNTANRVVARLEEDGVIEEVTGYDRNRLFRAPEICRVVTGDWRHALRG